MGDYDLDNSDFHLYGIPEFPEHDKLQTDLEVDHGVVASIEGREQRSSGNYSPGNDSDDDVIFILSKPVEPAFPPDTPMVNNTAHHLQGSSIHVTQSDQLRWHAPLEILRALPETSAILSHSAETNGQQHRRLLQGIIANPQRRRERAQALGQLRAQAAKLDFGSEQEALQISELRKLAQRLASKTEKSPTELYTEYTRLARNRQASPLPRVNEVLVEARYLKTV
jgi:hypothetical protein